MSDSKLKALFKGINLWFVLAVLGAIFFLGYLVGDRGSDGSAHRANGDRRLAGEVATLWTCSMHPQIKKPGPGVCPICGMDLIPVKSNSGAELAPRQLKLTPAAVQLADIQVAPVRRRQVSTQLRLVGKVDYDETRIRYISAWIPGRIDRLFVDVTGTTVKAGQPLISIYSPDLLVAQEELRQARLALEAIGGETAGNIAETARRTIASVKEKLRLWGLSSLQVEELYRLEAPVEHLTIPSPIGGVVIRKEAVEGMYVGTGAKIYTVVDLSAVWVKMDAYETDLQWLRTGQRVQFEAEAFPGDTFAGIVAFIDPVINGATRTVKVRLNVPNPGGRLKPEMFVKAIVKPVAPKSGGDALAPLVIPSSAPLLTGTRAVVYVAVDRERGIYEGRDVLLGSRTGDFYVVREGLSEGELVVVNGAFKIDSDLEIRGKPSMMNPVGGAPVIGHDHGETLAIPDDFATSIGGLMTAYLGIQRALSDDDEGDARKKLGALSEALARVDSGALAGSHLEMWRAREKRLRSIVEGMSRTTTIRDLRALFSDLDSGVEDTVRAFGGKLDRTIYRFHCPMALDNKGAYWFQDQPETRNPYFGASMSKCQDLKEVWNPHSPQTPGDRRQTGE